MSILPHGVSNTSGATVSPTFVMKVVGSMLASTLDVQGKFVLAENTNLSGLDYMIINAIGSFY